MTTIDPHRRQEIKFIVLSALQRIPNASLPVKIKELCKSYQNIRLISYSAHMKRYNLSYEEMKEYCGTSDSCADYYATHDKYIIYYNDIDVARIVNSNRYRWNIAHELGHVLLSHHKSNIKTRIYRCSLSDTEYDYFEAEADYFAQLILVPHAALSGFKIDNSRNIRYMCKISDPASKRRYYEYIKWKSHISAKDEYDCRVFYYYFNFIYKRKCKHCGTGVVQRYGAYCPVCGQKTLNWGDGDKMKYPLLKTLDNGKLKECPVCNNEETDIDGDYCQICGANLINHCSNNNCSNTKILPSNARYCPICGGTSTFYYSGYLKEWNYKESNNIFDTSTDIPAWIDKDLPFN